MAQAWAQPRLRARAWLCQGLFSFSFYSKYGPDPRHSHTEIVFLGTVAVLAGFFYLDFARILLGRCSDFARVLFGFREGVIRIYLGLQDLLGDHSFFFSELAWILHGFAWTLLGFDSDCTWAVLGFFAALARIIMRGFCVGFIWILQGFCSDLNRIVFGLSLSCIPRCLFGFS